MFREMTIPNNQRIIIQRIYASIKANGFMALSEPITKFFSNEWHSGKKINAEILLGYAIMAAFFSMPFGTAPPTAFGAVAATIWLLSGKFIFVIKHSFKQSWFWPIVFIVALHLAGLIYSTDPSGLGFRFARKSHYWLYGLSMVSLFFTRFPAQRFIQAFMAGLAINAFFGVLQLIELYPKVTGWCTGIGRGYNTLSAYLIIGILVSSYYFRQATKNKTRYFWAFLSALYFFHLIILLGRTGYFTFFVLTPFIAHNFFKHTKVLKLLLACALRTGWMFASPFVRERAALTMNQLTYHINADQDIAWGKVYTEQQDRLYMWYGAVKIFFENPILGSGTGSYKTAMKGRGRPEWPDVPHPHNDFLYMAASFGILGIFAYIWLFSEIIRNAWKERQNPLGNFILSSALVTLVSGLFNAQLLDAGMAFMVSFTVGLQQWLPKFASPNAVRDVR